MKARLKPIKAYELLDANGKVLARLTKASTWEGMVKLEGRDGQFLIVVAPDGMAAMVAESLGQLTGDGVLQCDVMAGSHGLLEAVAAMQGQAKDPGGAA